MPIVIETMTARPTPCASATPRGPMLPVVGPLATNATTLPAPRNTNSSVPTNSAVSGRSSLGMARSSRLWAAPIYLNSARCGGFASGTPQHHCGVDAAESERVGEHHVGRRRAAFATQAVQIAGGVRMLQVDGGREPAALHGER